MTNDEFQRAYHEYMTEDRASAQAAANAIELEDGQHPAVVGLPFGARTLYCLMLPTAAAALSDLGIPNTNTPLSGGGESRESSTTPH